MLQITFKSVGQGDSILIEWKDEHGAEHVGIIDCNLVEKKRNPVLEHIKKKGYTEIDFLVLSHPHSDHFSGFLSLIEYCEANGIGLGTFYHSCHQVPEYLKAACESTTSEKEIYDLLAKIMELFRNGKMDKQKLYYNKHATIDLPNSIKIKCLSPSEWELDKYISGTKYWYNDEEGDSNPKANLLSSMFKIYCEDEDWYILLTADADKHSFYRLDKKHPSEFLGKLVLAQCPHHGSEFNCSKAFWEKKSNSDGCFVVFSVGKNKHGHPNQKTRDVFINNGYQLRYTTDLAKLLTQSKEAKMASGLLNPFSSLVIENKDVVFKIEKGGLLTEIS